MAHVKTLEAHLERRFSQLVTHPAVSAIRHRGVMAGIDLCQRDGNPLDPTLGTGHRVAMTCRPRGAIVRPLGDTIVVNPPLVITASEIDRLIDIITAAIDAVVS